MDVISVAASIAGLLTVSARVYAVIKGFVSNVADAPGLARSVRDEIHDIAFALSQLQPLVLGQVFADASRKAMIDADRFLIMLTGTVCTFSELEKEVTGLTGLAIEEGIGALDHVRWARKEPRISQLFQHLQRHKSSLTLTLNILTCQSLAEATSTTHRLCEQIDQLVESNVELSNRLRTLESSLTSPGKQPHDDDSSILTAGTTEGFPRIRKSEKEPQCRYVTHAFEKILSSTRVYQNVSLSNTAWSLSNSETQTIQTECRTARTKGWSVLSGLSLADISNISVLSLPLSACELYNPLWYDGSTNVILSRHASPPTEDTLDSNKTWREKDMELVRTAESGLVQAQSLQKAGESTGAFEEGAVVNAGRGLGGLEPRLVVAIKCGAANTSVAFATPVGNKAFLDEIDIMCDWDQGFYNHVKISSIISYLSPSYAQWGVSLSPEPVAMVNTMLELGLDETDNPHSQCIRASQYSQKEPEDIVEDYFTKNFDFVLEALSRLVKELRARMLVDIVVAVPEYCSYRAKNSAFRVLTRAGFNEDTFPTLREMLLISEPEAAAIYTARYLKELNGADFLTKGDRFVLCDAGGVSVDAVSYQVKQLQPTFEIEAVTFATGCQCGSIFIDLAFKKWLRKLLGEENYQQLDQTQLAHKISSHDTEGQQMRELMKDFNTLKRKFRGDSRDMKINLPMPLENLNMDDRVIKGEITITNNDMRSFFDPRIDRILDLILGQAAQVEMRQRRQIHLKSVFLIGGFAESEYLQEKIRLSLQLRNIQIRRPDTSWTAVVRGGAIFGIEKSTSRALSKMSACPRSYGVLVDESFSEIRQSNKDRFVDLLTGASMAKKQLMWLIKKGDLILSDEPRVVKQQFAKIFSETDPRKGTIPIYTCYDDDTPEGFSNSQNEITIIHTLKCDLTDIPLRKFTRQQLPGNSLPFYVTYLRLEMRLDPQLLSVELCWGDRTLCSASISCL